MIELEPGAQSFTCTQLTSAHAVDAFDCADEALNRWLREHARHMHARRYSRVFVWTGQKTSKDVFAYFCLSATAIRRDELQQTAQRSELAHIPAFLLGKLALDRRLQGQGLARVLIADAVRIAVRASESVAARFMVVDAVDDYAASIYESCGFSRVDGLRLLARLDDLRAAVTEANHT